MTLDLGNALEAAAQVAKLAGHDVTLLHTDAKQVRFQLIDDAGDLWTLRATARGNIITLVYPNGNYRMESVRDEMDLVNRFAFWIEEMIFDLS